MPQYAVLIYQDESAYADPEVLDRLVKAHTEFGERNQAVIRGGSGLHTVDTATSVRENGSGTFNVTDGAFVETKEALGGFYLIETPDLDSAIEVAKQVPAWGGGVEVRPVR